MNAKKDTEKPEATPKIRRTINLPERAHAQLSELTLLASKGTSTRYKQNVAAGMIGYFHKNKHLLKEIKIS